MSIRWSDGVLASGSARRARGQQVSQSWSSKWPCGWSPTAMRAAARSTSSVCSANSEYSGRLVNADRRSALSAWFIDSSQMATTTSPPALVRAIADHPSYLRGSTTLATAFRPVLGVRAHASIFIPLFRRRAGSGKNAKESSARGSPEFRGTRDILPSRGHGVRCTRGKTQRGPSACTAPRVGRWPRRTAETARPAPEDRDAQPHSRWLTHLRTWFDVVISPGSKLGAWGHVDCRDRKRPRTPNCRITQAIRVVLA